MQKVTCQNHKISKYCQGEFFIEPDDFVFYEKIKVPPPTFCPECRMIRRLTWRNNRSLYSRSCGLCSKKLISFMKDDDRYPKFKTHFQPRLEYNSRIY